MRHRFPAVLAAALLGGWSPAAGQTEPAADVATAPPAFAGEVVVTATLEPAAAERVSATVDRIDAAEIERRQATRVVDLLRTLPGVAVTQAGSPGKVASLFVRGTSSAHTLVLLDGVVLNDPTLGAFDASTATPEGLDRIEVVRGPYSALYGSGAVGGVIQLLTRAPAGRTFRLRLAAGSDDFARAGLAVAASSGPIAFDLAGHLRQGEGALANDDFDARDGQLRVDARPDGAWRVGLLARAAHAEAGLPLDWAGAATPRRRQEWESTLVALPLDWHGANRSLELRFSRLDGELAVADPDDPFAASRATTGREQARGVLAQRFGEDWSLAAGADWQRETATTATAFGPGLADARQRASAGFAQLSFGRGPLRLDVGVRRDDHSSFGGATSFRGGAVVAVGQHTRLRASWGESFRAPSLGDLYYPFFGNPELEAERGESGELGVEADLGSARLRLTAFRSELEQLIQYDFVRGLPWNLGRARMQGVEATADLRHEAWSARLDATWLDAEDRATGGALLRRPEWAGSLLAGWRGERSELAATLRYHGERFDVGEVRLPGYSVVDLAAGWRTGGRIAPFARLENVFDRDYEEAAGFPALGRTWAAGVTVRGGR
jgi:vitamin B12 transporter